MEFDKTRVYMAVNADELPIGSRCIFAHDLPSLREAVSAKSPKIIKLDFIRKEHFPCRFVSIDKTRSEDWALAYLIEPPSASDQKERKYKPFSNMENLKKVAVECKRFIKAKQGTQEGIIIGISFDNRVIIKKRYGLECLTIVQLFERYTFDDGTPCGELVEE